MQRKDFEAVRETLGEDGINRVLHEVRRTRLATLLLGFFLGGAIVFGAYLLVVRNWAVNVGEPVPGYAIPLGIVFIALGVLGLLLAIWDIVTSTR